MADFAALRPLLMQLVGEGDGAHARRGQVDPFRALGQEKETGEAASAKRPSKTIVKDFAIVRGFSFPWVRCRRVIYDSVYKDNEIIANSQTVFY
jgi:hypothetical protein